MAESGAHNMQGSRREESHLRRSVRILRARLCQRPEPEFWDVTLSAESGLIERLEPHDSSLVDQSSTAALDIVDANGSLLVPAMCHAHIHLDKCFLLDDPGFRHLSVEKGDFEEAMSITGQAKSSFTVDDLIRRGTRLIEESLDSGVTAMRAFVEVDEIVELRSLDAAITLKERYRDECEVQICAFAQLSLFSGASAAVLGQRRSLLQEASLNPGVHVLGSTPYVEKTIDSMRENAQYLTGLAIHQAKLLDFHMDYTLDADRESFGTEQVVDMLNQHKWKRPVALGHCTRLTTLPKESWQELKAKIGSLDLAFVGLPLSDMFIMGRPESGEGGGQRPRGTLQVPQMVSEYGLKACIAINNVGNGFTPYSNSDLLRLASFGTVVYQAARDSDAELLYGCISTYARAAIGLASAAPAPASPASPASSSSSSASSWPGSVTVGEPAELVLLGTTARQGQAGVVPSIAGIVRGGQASVRALFKSGRRLSRAAPPPAP